MSSTFYVIIPKRKLNEASLMKLRKKEYGTSNIIGRNVEHARKKQGIKQKDFIAKLQLLGLDINPTSYSKLEGQLRSANDQEIYYIAKALHISIDDLFQL